MDRPMEAVVWSRLRLRRRPSGPSRAASRVLQTSAGRSDCNESLAIGMALSNKPRCAIIIDRYVETITCALGACQFGAGRRAQLDIFSAFGYGGPKLINRR